jgi:alpha-galactosidase
VLLLALPDAQSLLAGVGSQADWRLFLGGYNSFTTSFAYDSRHRYRWPRWRSAAVWNQHSESPYHGRSDCLASPWFVALTRQGGAQPTLLLGYLTARVGLGELALLRGSRPQLHARLGLGGKLLAGGQTIDGDPLLCGLSQPGAGQQLLTDYTTESGRRMAARTGGSVPSGWCSWYHYYTQVSAAAVAANLTALAHAGPRLPIRYVQLDDGYQPKVGDWQQTNAKFPGGLAALATQVRSAGFLPGLWTAPFLVQRSAQLFADRPDWLLRDNDGQLRPLAYHPPWGLLDGQVYSLDPTHPAVLDWLSQLFTSLRHSGFAYFKIDFLAAGLRQGRHYNPSRSPVEGYRDALTRIRDAVGDGFLLGCGAPLLPSVGLVDGLRISSDVKERWRDPLTALVAGESGHPAAELAVLNSLTRAHLHRRWFLGDPDCLLVRQKRSQLTLSEVQTLASVLCLGGGALFLSDDLTELDPERRALAERALPPLGPAARTSDLLTRARPTHFVRHHLGDSGPEALAAVLNWSDRARQLTLRPADLDLPTGSYHSYELWSGRYQRLWPDEALTLTQPPHATALLLLRPALDRPQLVTATHHLGQTTTLLRREAWQPTASGGELVIDLELAAERRGELLLALPPGWQPGRLTPSGGLTLGAEQPFAGGLRLTVTLHGAGSLHCPCHGPAARDR